MCLPKPAPGISGNGSCCQACLRSIPRTPAVEDQAVYCPELHMYTVVQLPATPPPNKTTHAKCQSIFLRQVLSPHLIVLLWPLAGGSLHLWSSPAWDLCAVLRRLLWKPSHHHLRFLIRNTMPAPRKRIQHGSQLLAVYR